jgi:hypothetical protein
VSDGVLDDVVHFMMTITDYIFSMKEMSGKSHDRDHAYL